MQVQLSDGGPLGTGAVRVREIEPRAIEILDSIKGIFASKGFERASMQDLAQAAGMSAGNFYRYFPSKDAIIETMVERDIDEVQQDFARVLHSDTPLETLRELVRRHVEEPAPCDGAIWCEIEAAAGRRPEVAVLLNRMDTRITDALVAVFARIAGLRIAEADARFSAHARLIMLLVKGLTMQGASPAAGNRPDHALAALVMRVIERSLTEIAGHAADPATTHLMES